MTNVVDFYVFWGEESDNGIGFYPSGTDFAEYDMTIFQNYRQGGHSCTDVLIVLICTGIKNVLPNVLIKACFLGMYCLMYWDP